MSAPMLSQLCSAVKLERDKGLLELEKYLQNEKQNKISELLKELLKLLSDDTASWEIKHGSLMAAKSIFEHKSFKCSEHIEEDFVKTVQEKALHLLNDPEYRVRSSAGEVMGALCKLVGSDVYSESKLVILEGIRSNLERQPGHEEAEKLVEKLGQSTSPIEPGARRGSLEATEIFHDTAGWKSLETWMKCLQNMIEGSSYGFNRFVNQELLDLIFSALDHTNRFVRETGYYVCSSLVGCGLKERCVDGKTDSLKNTSDVILQKCDAKGGGPSEEAALAKENAIYRHGDQFAEYLGKGLSDNWSQVRLAASVATRRFLMSLPTETCRVKFYPELLPRLCLNRYYVAEGVRIYSQETWRLLTHGAGKQLVEKYMEHVVKHYIAQTEADNHAVREAACACIAELGSKIEKRAVAPYIAKLLAALLVCFSDDSWPVRDAACIACGNFVQCFPKESRGSMPSLYPLFHSNLQDNIPSVRQGAAIALSRVVSAYGEESYEHIFPKLEEGFKGVEKQAASAQKYSNLDKGPATYGVVKQLRDNDDALHTNQTMYSCGSLAPKMGRGRGGGCMDHQFRKPPEPWELADGCIHLVAELSPIRAVTQKLNPIFPLMAKACSYRHYTQHVYLLESMCKQLANIAKGLGKRPFKQHLEAFLDPIFYSLSCDNVLTSSTASNCIIELSNYLGPGIFRGRVEQYNPDYLTQLDTLPLQPM
ncbi:uncharacterized protein LOC121371570 [Gigantopelta aegis]|uniref:uncharacterized protein LOC121371570 n=1 Tax=Gigantopelta aegis TaxID=1735272 RepID=UPI001B88BE66|nr:uncharacterized protein LOC121371570 [Gigantopelta aegis]